jgi:NitT/TauT family transport system substrate-binding protein
MTENGLQKSAVQRRAFMKTLHVEHTHPFQALPELVAEAEGLFDKHGIKIEWVDTSKGADRTARTDVTSPANLDPFRSHGRLLEQGKADMYNACEWGNYCRVQDSRVGSRQLGRRSVVTFAALIVRPDSPVFTPQQLAHRKVGVPFYFGTHYLALHMLEGFLPRDEIVVCSVPHGSRYRFDLLMSGEIEATTMTEPYVSLAEKKGCRIIATSFFHGTQVGSSNVDAETLLAYNNAVREAVRRIQADKRKYLQYFIDHHKKSDPEIGTLTVDDMRESRLVVCEPAPIPADEMERTYHWLKSWGMLESSESPIELVNLDVQERAHVQAAE